MPTPICTAPKCGKPAPNGHLCGSCRAQLVDDLRALPGVFAQLDITISRQDRLGDSSRRAAGDERPLPMRVFAMEARRDISATLVIWALHVAARQGRVRGAARWFEPRQTAIWLATRIADVDSDPLAGTLADEIGWARVLGRRAVDKPLELKYAGPCDACQEDLYAHPNAPEIECRQCAAAYRVEARRDWLLKAAEDHLLTATEISRALPGLLPRDDNGRQPPLTAAMIRGWAHRGRLSQHPAHPSQPNWPLYRVGDVLDLVDDLHKQEIAS